MKVNDVVRYTDGSGRVRNALVVGVCEIESQPGPQVLNLVTTSNAASAVTPYGAGIEYAVAIYPKGSEPDVGEPRSWEPVGESAAAPIS